MFTCTIILHYYSKYDNIWPANWLNGSGRDTWPYKIPHFWSEGETLLFNIIKDFNRFLNMRKYRYADLFKKVMCSHQKLWNWLRSFLNLSRDFVQAKHISSALSVSIWLYGPKHLSATVFFLCSSGLQCDTAVAWLHNLPGGETLSGWPPHIHRRHGSQWRANTSGVNLIPDRPNSVPDQQTLCFCC